MIDVLTSDEENIAIMHAFVDSLHFKDQSFVEALRLFLQSFRLPGEAQKIDRFMLKFAERYMAGNAKTPFASAGVYLLPHKIFSTSQTRQSVLTFWPTRLFF